MWSKDSTDEPLAGSVLNSTLVRLCMDRLRFYSTMDELVSSRKEWHSIAMERMKDEYLDFHRFCTGNQRPFVAVKSRRYEKLSRTVLCFAVARDLSRDVVRWFLDNELRLFSFYFKNLTPEAKIDFLTEPKLIKQSSEDNTFEVDWKFVLPLIKKRSVSIKDGLAIINYKHLDVVASHYINDRIQSHLQFCQRELPFILLDPRMKELIDDLVHRINKYVQRINRPSRLIDNSNIRLKDLDDISEGFPPCMERVYEHLERKHHLRYHGRLQFLPFLKDIGLSLIDTLQYFQEHLTNTLSLVEYNKKKYPYFIRYIFGLEGRGVESGCLSCSQIQSRSYEGTSDCHGCPLQRRQSIEDMFTTPKYNFISLSEKRNILAQINKVPVGIICGKIISLRINNSVKNLVISNPIQYFSMYYNSTNGSDDSEFSE